jgi:hypothetical protein
MKIRPIQIALLLAPWIFGFAMADSPLPGAVGLPDAVHWTLSAKSTGTITPGSAATLDLSGDVQDGWHVYGFEQHAGGPTPLRVTIDENAVATAVGALSGPGAQKVQDSHFGFETQLYTHPFIVHLPVRLSRDLAPGRQLIPVSVRFQACSDRECLLPRTVHLSVPIDVLATG